MATNFTRLYSEVAGESFIEVQHAVRRYNGSALQQTGRFWGDFALAVLFDPQ